MNLTDLEVVISPKTFEPIAIAKVKFSAESVYHLAALGDEGYATLGKAFAEAYYKAREKQGWGEWKSK